MINTPLGKEYGLVIGVRIDSANRGKFPHELIVSEDGKSIERLAKGDFSELFFDKVNNELLYSEGKNIKKFPDTIIGSSDGIASIESFFREKNNKGYGKRYAMVEDSLGEFYFPIEEWMPNKTNSQIKEAIDNTKWETRRIPKIIGDKITIEKDKSKAENPKNKGHLEKSIKQYENMIPEEFRRNNEYQHLGPETLMETPQGTIIYAAKQGSISGPYQETIEFPTYDPSNSRALLRGKNKLINEVGRDCIMESIEAVPLNYIDFMKETTKNKPRVIKRDL